MEKILHIHCIRTWGILVNEEIVEGTFPGMFHSKKNHFLSIGKEITTVKY